MDALLGEGGSVDSEGSGDRSQGFEVLDLRVGNRRLDGDCNDSVLGDEGNCMVSSCSEAWCFIQVKESSGPVYLGVVKTVYVDVR